MVVPHITCAEWRWVIISSLGILFLSSIPYLVGYASQTPDLRFGGAVFDRMDYSVHLASIQTGLRGQWQYPMLHTSEQTEPAYVKMFYILVGQLGRLLPLSPPALFELTRWVGGMWMLLTMYVLAARFLWSVALRRIALLFCGLGSGVGWLMLMFQWQPQPGVSPIDFWLIDLYGLFSVLALPHIAVVMALLWTTLVAMLAYWKAKGKRWLIVGVAAIVAAEFIQPFAPFVVDVVLTAYAGWNFLANRRTFALSSLVLLAILQMPLAIYAVSLLYFDPMWAVFTQQNITPSPSPIYYILGLGFVGGLAFWGAWRIMRRRFDDAYILIIWIVVVVVLVYLPLQFQRRFTEGVIGPLAILASMGLGYGFLPALKHWKGFRRRLAKSHLPFARARNLIVFLVILASTLSTLYLIFGGALLGALRSPKLFDSGDVVQGVDWLGEHSDWQATVWSAEQTGMMIPARIGHRVYLGHQFETIDYETKIGNVARFFDLKTSDNVRIAWLRECNCQFVFYGATERALGDFDPTQSAYLQQVYENTTVSIFRVQNLP